jgi:hypothetical protein
MNASLHTYEIMELKPQGGIGSMVGILCLNWLEAVLNLYKPMRLLKGLLLAFWGAVCGTVNSMGFLLDQIDKAGVFYGNVFLVGRKVCA